VCGIAGFLSTGAARPGMEVLCAMGDAMAHRGPDASGTHLSPDGRVGLSHRRLSILDLSPAGAQPMFSADGSLALSFNGEVYNFREIRKELSGRGHTFRGGSDTEVMLAAFREWGVDAAVRRFIGMCVRSAAKLECISALIERARARAVASRGQSPRSGNVSARYSSMASESHTVTVPSFSAGNLPVGECSRTCRLESGWYKAMRCSTNGMPACFIASHGRRDHDE